MYTPATPVQKIAHYLVVTLLIIGAAAVLVPIVFMITASAMPAGDILAMPYRWIPRGFHVENFVRAIRGNDASFIFLRLTRFFPRLQGEFDETLEKRA